MPPLAQVLVDGGRVALDEMESVVEEHVQTGQSVARVLISRGLVTEADLMWAMAQEMGLEFVDLDMNGIDLAASMLIPENTARHHNVLVIASDGGVPVVAMSNPTDVFALDDLRTIMGRGFTQVVATRSQIETYIGKAYGNGGDAADMAVEASLGFEAGADDGLEDIQAVTDEAPIVRYVNLLILQALNERASDIHVEPTAKDLRIRYRIDGVLHDASSAPRSIAGAVTTRLKVMADMNIAEHRVPQDGRISLNVGTKGVDLRMATLPTIHGEKIVMRVLDKSSVVLGFADLGFDEDLLEVYEGIFTKPYGTLLVTGPTGSGKSTTLYTTLSALNSPEKNIITVEDPVELQIQGINQVQLNIKAGLTFASALKSILRSDPDIVLVGEIRDEETALIAIEASLTGHLVLATLHTNSAASTPMRLVEMGLQPFLVTSALSGVLAQRLARRLCQHCKSPFEPTEADIIAAGWTLEEVEEVGKLETLYQANGCPACSNTGYRGRKALAELMPITEEIERLIIEGGSVDEIHRLAVSQGMVTLRQSGLRKALEGETTLEEVLRVVA
ncbi:MAG: ATPase, T2SS/T4P/T4SS family [Actinomycetota bacterium]|nr:ATPase, T2SS/T4P/T4SS family [Actinomycetota bacterium]